LDEQFNVSRFEYVAGDTIYLFSDGYSDQFGGEQGVKYKSKNFKQLLLDINKYDMQEQVRMIEKAHLDWRGETPQIDDVTVVGIKL
jgi:serine phosphatase RsbU (regulator of sigma subunit)